MKIDEFAELVKNRLPEYLSEYAVEDIILNDVIKNNGHALKAMTINIQGENLAPIIYLNNYYGKYLWEDDLDAVLKEMADDYMHVREKLPRDGSEFTDYHPDRLFLKAVNYEKNKESLKDIVYEKFLNLALVVRCEVVENKNEIGSYAVSNESLERWNVPRWEVVDKARKNTPEQMGGPVIRSMQDILAGLLQGQGFEEEPELEKQMYIVSNAQNMNGATLIAYPEIIAGLLQEVGMTENAYILPSSIHEILVVPEKDNDPLVLARTVREVNRTAVSDMDYLSDSVYKFDAKEKEIQPMVDTRIIQPDEWEL